ncbi:MAG: hypothetical protein HC933_22340 [Pleurocapsa sp. SU_196_0]|nr:hypothetical protein [Pleurocapsa sp. SU_196_0]
MGQTLSAAARSLEKNARRIVSGFANSIRSSGPCEIHFAPNFPNIEALAKLVSSDSLAEPSQLLIRLHPSHFQDKPKIFADERAQVFELEKKYPHVHVVQPVALGGSLGYYGGEDMDEKSS